MSNQPAFTYQQAAAQGASPIGQIIALYDTILRDFGRAVAALEAGNIAARVHQLNHALSVIGYLQSVLDHDRGGEAAKNFERFYNLTREMIVKANARATRESMEELIRLYSGVRQAWYKVEQRSISRPSPSPVPSSGSHAAKSTNEGDLPSANRSYDEFESSHSHWSV